MFGFKKKSSWICGLPAYYRMTIPRLTDYHGPEVVDVCTHDACKQITSSKILQIRLCESKKYVDILNREALTEGAFPASEQSENVKEFFRLGDTNSDTLGGDEMHTQPLSNQESDEVYPLIPGRVPSTVPDSLEEWCRQLDNLKEAPMFGNQICMTDPFNPQVMILLPKEN